MLRLIIHTCLLSAVALFLLAAPALATNLPSSENCAEVGTISVDCYTCAGEKLGSVTVDARYDSSKKSCLFRFSETRDQCAKLNNNNKKLEFKWKYFINTREFSGNKRCCY